MTQALMTARPIFYDTETTGVRADSDRIIEIAAYDPVRDLSFEHLVNPGIRIPPEATSVHNITDDMVASAPSFAEVSRKFIEFCEGDVILIAHNNDGFDVHFLRNEFGRHQVEMPQWRFLDSLKWARRYRPDLPRHTLQFLRETYQIPANNAHRALDDVIVLYKVFSHMVDDLDIETIFRLINQPRQLQHMPFGKHQGKPLKDIPADYIEWLVKNGALDKPDNKDLREAFVKLGKLN